MPVQVEMKSLLEKHTMVSAPELAWTEADGGIRCVACGHRCRVYEGKTGVCRVRFNRDGRLRVPAGYVASLQIDPIEKKPFFHAFPGRDALSFGMLGCDYHCSYCQNWITSQVLRDDQAVSLPKICEPRALVDLAIEHQAPVMVSTYNEPLITADWAMTVFREARERGITCGFVSNGNATPEVLEYIRPCVDLYKVDLKGFDDGHYRRLGGTLQSVLSTIERLVEMGFWVEVVTLVVPGFNDSMKELSQIAEFLASVSIDIPWHVTAFHPDYKMTDPPRTSADALVQACQLGKSAGLRYVYSGNLPGAVGELENTKCHHCGTELIRREGFHVTENLMSGDSCSKCQTVVPGVWETNPPRVGRGFGVPRPVTLG